MSVFTLDVVVKIVYGFIAFAVGSYFIRVISTLIFDSSARCNDATTPSNESCRCLLRKNDDEGKSQRCSVAEKPERNRNGRRSSSNFRKPSRPVVVGKRRAGHSREGSTTSTRIFKASDAEFSLHEIYGDGNCLFRAISYILWGTESRHRYLRSLVVNHIGSTWREIKPFVQAEWSIASLREYMGFMDADGTFASELECLIATKLNRLNLAIYRRADAAGNLRRILYSQYNRRAPTANLLFSGKNEFGHYDVLLPVR